LKLTGGSPWHKQDDQVGYSSFIYDRNSSLLCTDQQSMSRTAF
jgi:hypothetical protein